MDKETEIVASNERGTIVRVDLDSLTIEERVQQIRDQKAGLC